jgi:hypothetical protein
MDIKDEIGEGSIGVSYCAHCCRRIRDEVSGAVPVVGWEENFLGRCSCEALDKLVKAVRQLDDKVTYDGGDGGLDGLCPEGNVYLEV